jgi:hypothetical protein
MSRPDSDVLQVPLGIDFTCEPPQVRWQPWDGSRLTEPFFDDAVARVRRDAGRPLPVETTPLAAWAASPPLVEPAAVIFHVSRCGSTLLSQMLAALPGTLVISEAPVFDDILRGRRGDPAISDVLRERWLQHGAAAFAASQAVAPARVVIKLDCWHIFELERIRRTFPNTPLLFVYREPLEVLASLATRPSLTLVRDTVAPEEIGVDREERDALSRDELAAAIVGSFFREAARHRTHLTPIAYPSLSERTPAIPGWQFSDEEVRTLRDAARFDAKRPGRTFVPDSAATRAEAAPAVRRACATWADAPYARWCAAL